LGQTSPEWTRNVLGFYVPYLAHCQRVLDVGCGEGQLIELLQAAGVDAVGIDLDARMVEVCQDRGLDVVQADLFDYLPQHQGRFDGIFCSNLIEHLRAQEAVRFLQAASGTLAPGGILLVTTPNPESLIVHLYEFWRDATHIRLYNRSLLEFLFHWSGLERIESGENSRTTWTSPLDLQEIPQLLEGLSYRPRIVPWELGLPPLPQPDVPKELPALRRVLLVVRRRLGRFLSQAVLFEEFAALNNALFDMQQIERALYEVQNSMLSRPREIFALGFKSSTPAEGTQ
jgi:SAM-dependent methyltransferase